MSISERVYSERGKLFSDEEKMTYILFIWFRFARATHMQTAGSRSDTLRSHISMRPSPVTLPKIVAEVGLHAASCTTCTN